MTRRPRKKLYLGAPRCGQIRSMYIRARGYVYFTCILLEGHSGRHRGDNRLGFPYRWKV